MTSFKSIVDRLNPMKNRELNLCPMVRLALASLTMTPALMAQEAQAKKEQPIEPEQRAQATEEIFDFNIPGQPLSSSLAEIATQSKVKLSFDKALATGIQAKPVQGKFSAQQAFHTVLQDSGLKVAKMKNGYELITDNSDTEKLANMQVEGQRQLPNRVSSRKFVEPLKSTQTTEVIDSEIIDQQGITSIKDVLRNSPGISFRAAEGGPPSGDNLFIRGLSATNDVFVDGMRNSGEQSRDAYNLQQVEVFKGPNSSNFGRGSAGGAINLVTKSAQLEDFTTLKLGLGTDDYLRTTVDSNWVLDEEDGIAIRINGMYSQSNTPDRAEINSDSFAIAPTITFGLGTNTRFKIGLEHIEQNTIQDNGIPALAYQSYNRNGLSGRSGVDDSNFYGFKNQDVNEVTSHKLNFGVEHDYDPDWTFSNNTSLQQTKSFVNGTKTNGIGTGQADGSVNANDFGTDVNFANRNRDTEVISLQNQSLLTGEFETGDFKHNMVLGLDFSWEEFTRYELTRAEYSMDGGATFNSGAFTNLFNPDVSNIISRGGGNRTGGKQSSKAFGSGLYLGDTIELTDQWSVNGLARLDYYRLNQQDTRVNSAQSTDGLTSEDWLLSWRFGLTYKPVENGSIYLGVGNSMSPASANAANGFIVSDSSSSTTNVGLEPIETRSYELGTKWEFFDAKLNLFAAAFQNDVENDLTALPGASDDEFIQTGKKRVRGISLGASGQVTDNWTLLFGYTYMESKISSLDPAEDGEDVPFVPKHAVSLWSQHQITSKFSVGLGAQYSGQMNYDNEGQNAPKEAEYLLWNAMATYQFTDNFSMQLNVNNLLDEDYIAAGSTNRVLPGAGRSVLLNLSYTF